MGVDPQVQPTFQDLFEVQRRTCPSENALPEILHCKEGDVTISFPTAALWAAVVAKGGYYVVSGVPHDAARPHPASYLSPIPSPATHPSMT